jgi:hypothetical protein
VRWFKLTGTPPNLPPHYNAAPGRDLRVIRLHPETGERVLGELRWGLIPYWAKDRKIARAPPAAPGLNSPCKRHRLRPWIVCADAGAVFRGRSDSQGAREAMCRVGLDEHLSRPDRRA